MSNSFYSQKPRGEWKKVLESDLDYVVEEVKSLVTTPAFFILDGEVGAGKTTFVKHFMYGMLVDNVTSPTYSLINESDNMVHGDLYRIKYASEIQQLEISLYLEDKEYVFVEWGKPYYKIMAREINIEFNHYEISISMVSNSSTARNFVLSSIC